MNVRLMGSLCLMLAATLPVAASASAAPAQERTPTISVNGTASTVREPDIARTSLSVETNGETASEATQQNAAIAARVRSAVEGRGIPASAIVTQYYNLRYNPRPEPTPPTVPTRRPAGATVVNGERYGYVVSHTLEITSSPSKVGAVIDAATAAGATSVGGVVYDLSNRHGAYLEAVRQAVADAKSQALAAAAASGARLGAIRRIFVGGERVLAPMQAPSMRALAAPVPTEVTPGEVRIFANVSITYELVR